MKWSPDQERALDAAGRWLQGGGAPVFKLLGAAGTGKTELARHLAAGAGRAVFAAPTGKAAMVMERRGCVGARTIHSLIYRPKEKSRKRLTELTEQLETLPIDHTDRAKVEEEIAREAKSVRSPNFDLKEESELVGADLIVVDEASMVNKQIAEDLIGFGIPILALGDPHQLPPVYGTAPWVNDATVPDALLEEPHRFALESAILRYATHIRTHGDYDWKRGGEADDTVRFVVKNDLSHADIFGLHDVVLAGRNATRRQLNKAARRTIHNVASGLPIKNERLICLKNAFNYSLVNGSLLTVAENAVRGEDKSASMVIHEMLAGGDDRYLSLNVHTAPFDDYDTPGVLERTPEWEFRDSLKMDYAYGLTVHKAQGSQWETVMVINESGAFSDARRWLYTAVTRAQTKLTVLQ